MRCAVPLLAVLAALAGVAGCGRDENAGPGTEAGAGSLAWRGSSPCADCEGIETVLVLQREDGADSYRLSETYLTAGDAVRFDDTGRWEMHGAALRMHGDGGSERLYALLPDGRLQARDGAGRRLRSGSGDALEPAGAAGP